MVDWNSVRVSVGDVVYERAVDLIGVSGDSTVFFLQENEDDLTEVYFGDGSVLGAAPQDGATVVVTYRTTIGSAGNGINSVRIENPTTHGVVVTVKKRSEGGDDGEDVESIRHVAPMARRSRGRFVTTDDYEAGVLSEFGDVRAVSVWGGEDNVPSDNGAVYLSIVPRMTDFVSNRRERDVSAFLKRRGVVGTRHVFVRPAHLFVVPIITIRYDPRRTTKAPGRLLEDVREAVIGYETSELGGFDKNFYSSHFVAHLVRVDDSILGVVVDVRLQRRLVLEAGITRYVVSFNNPFRLPSSNVPGTIGSSNFEYLKRSDARFDDDGNGVLRIHRVVAGGQEVLRSPSGTFDYARGVVIVEDFQTTAETPIRINAHAAGNDVIVVRNQILGFSDVQLSLIDQLTGRQVGSVTDVVTAGDGTVLDDSFSNDVIF